LVCVQHMYLHGIRPSGFLRAFQTSDAWHGRCLSKMPRILRHRFDVGVRTPPDFQSLAATCEDTMSSCSGRALCKKKKREEKRVVVFSCNTNNQQPNNFLNIKTQKNNLKKKAVTNQPYVFFNSLT
jgi:hypothetical protein